MVMSVPPTLLALALALLITVAHAETSSLACPVASVAAKLHSCAQTDLGFLRCLQGKSKCECLLEVPSVHSCLGECAPVVLQIMCDKAAKKPITFPQRRTDAPSVREAAWAPPHSQYLTYKAVTNPLAGLDGVYVINLKRRPDRLRQFLTTSGLQEKEVHVLEAYDGKQLKEWTSTLENLFYNNTFKSRRAVIGCALSHFTLWRHIASTTNQFHLILEDDAILPSNFVDLWNSKYFYALPADAQLVYLGGVLDINNDIYLSGKVLKPVNRVYAEHKPTTVFAHDYDEFMDHIGPEQPRKRFHYTTNAYILSSEAARALVEMVRIFGFRHPADHMLMKMMDIYDATYATLPLIAGMPIADEMHGIDSDIQYDSDPIPGSPGTPGYCAATDSSCRAQQQPAVNEQQAAPSPSPAPAPASTPAPAPSPAAAPSPIPQQPSAAPSFSRHGAAQDVQGLRARPSFVETPLGKTRVVLFTVSGNPDQFLGDVEASFEQANLPYTMFAGTDARNLPVDALKTKGFLAKSYAGASRNAAYDIGALVLFEALAQLEEDYFVVLDDSVAVKVFFKEGLDSFMTSAPAGWDVLFFDCPSSCGEPRKPILTITPVDQNCPAPGAQAYVISKRIIPKIVAGALPVASSWDQQYLHRAGAKAYCVWPQIAKRNTQWHQWIMHV